MTWMFGRWQEPLAQRSSMACRHTALAVTALPWLPLLCTQLVRQRTHCCTSAAHVQQQAACMGALQPASQAGTEYMYTPHRRWAQVWQANASAGLFLTMVRTTYRCYGRQMRSGQTALRCIAVTTRGLALYQACMEAPTATYQHTLQTSQAPRISQTTEATALGRTLPATPAVIWPCRSAACLSCLLAEALHAARAAKAPSRRITYAS